MKLAHRGLFYLISFLRLSFLHWFIPNGYYIFMFILVSILVQLLIYNLDYLHKNQTIWDKHFSCHFGKTSLKTCICLQLNIFRSFSFLVQFEWCKKQHESQCNLYNMSLSSRSKKMLKLYNLFFQKMTHYFRMSYFLHFLFILCDLKSYGCTELSFILLFEASKAKDDYKIITNKMNVLNFNVWIRPMTKYFPAYFQCPYHLHFLSTLNDLSSHGCAKSSSKTSFWAWKVKEGCIRIFQFFNSLNVLWFTLVVTLR